MRIVFHDNQLCERGTTTSMADYARVMRRRGHDVVISHWAHSPANVPEVVRSLSDEFEVLAHEDRFSLGKAASGADAFYFIKAGEDDGLVAPGAHNLVHAVFQQYDPHGERYVYISEWLAHAVRERVMSPEEAGASLRARGKEAVARGCADALSFEHLDLIVDVPAPQGGVREELGIPEDAFVILRFGGWDTFDIGWAKDTVVRLLDRHSHWYFIGLNTEPFTQHPRARFLPMVMDPIEKSSIIAASNVFLTARGQGEAFGVAVAEALQLGVPVLAWNGGTDRNHIAMLKGLGALYIRPIDLRWRLRRLAGGHDPSSRQARMARGDQFRPDAIAPKLEALLTPEPGDGRSLRGG